MSLFDRPRSIRHASPVKLAAGLMLGAALALGSGCTVRPLYGSGTMSGDQTLTSEIRSIAIKPVNTRYGQEVRNHLIFLFNGGSGQPANAKYSLDLTVAELIESSLLIQNARQNEPTAGTLTLIGTYTLTDNGKGQVLATGQRQAIASYDIPKQEYAATRAVIDAENRAARELAQILQLAIAKEMTQR